MAGNVEEQRFALQLDDRTSGPAAALGRELRQLRARIDEDTKSLRAMQSSLGRLKAGGLAGSDAAKKLKTQIAGIKSAIGANEAQFHALGGNLRATASGGHAGADGLATLAERAREAGGPVGALAGRADGLVKLLGGAGLVGVALAAAAALVAVAGAAARAAAATLAFGIASADARRSELLHLEGLTTLRRYYGLARGSGAELQAQIDRVSDSSALSRDRVSAYAQQLYRMGLRGANATAALEAVTTAASVQGDAGAARIASWSAGLARTGGDVQRLAALVRSRLGGIAQRQVLALDVQTQRFHERLARLFSGLRIEGFLRALDAAGKILSSSTAEGEALAHILSALFNPLLDSVGSSGPVVRRFFQGMILGLQDVVIQVLEARAWFHRTFGKDFAQNIGTTTRALSAGRVAAFGIVAVLGLAAVAAVGLGVGLALAAVSAAVLVAPFVALAAAIGYGAFKAYEFGAWLGRYDWRGAATRLVDGLVNGITAGRDRVVGAVRGLAAQARAGLADALGIRSPSRVFAELGRQSARGYAAGVDAGGPDAGAAVDRMAGGVVARGSTIRGGDRALTIESLVVHAGSDAQAADIVARLREEFATLLEGAAIEMGAST